MNKDELLLYFNKNMIKKGYYYTYDNIPTQIGNAIYLYGDSHIYDMTAFFDCSDQLDGSVGMIVTQEGIFYQFHQKGHFCFQDIQSLSFQHHRHENAEAIIKTRDHTFIFDDEYLHLNAFLNALSMIINKDIEMILTTHEKIEYYIKTVLKDIENDEYEDIVLTTQQNKKIQDFYDNLKIIDSLDDENYQYELESLCLQALEFFDELELDSDEINILLDIQKEINQKEDQMFNNAKQYYDDMINRYQNGDTKMFDQVKSMMNMLGINEEDLKNKSPEEMNQCLEDLCSRFGISKSQIEQLAKKFQK